MRKGFLMLANAMEIDRWDAGVLRRLKHLCLIAGCDFYRMGLEEGKRNYAGIADVVFTEDRELIAAQKELPFQVVTDTWFPAKAIHSAFLEGDIRPMSDRRFDVGIFKRAGWEKNWDFLLDGPDPFEGRRVFIHCPWHERWYNDREKAIFHKVVRVCRGRGYFVDTRSLPYAGMPALYDDCRSVLLFSTTESDSRMMTEAYFRGCDLHLWSQTKHLMHRVISAAAKVFDTFDEIDFSNPGKRRSYRGFPTVADPIQERQSGFWGLETSRDVLLDFFASATSFSKGSCSAFRYHDAHSSFYHVCREGEEIKMMQEIIKEAREC